MNYTMYHNRTFLRHPSEMPIRIHCEDYHRHEAHTLCNVSLGGLACRSEEPLEVGSEVSVEIPVGQMPFKARATVAWCHRSRASYELGIQFIDSETAFAARMVEQLCYIERYRQHVYKNEGRTLDSSEAAVEWITKYANSFPHID